MTLPSGPVSFCLHASPRLTLAGPLSPRFACLQSLFNDHCSVAPGTSQARLLKVAHVNGLLDRLSAASGEGSAIAAGLAAAAPPGRVMAWHSLPHFPSLSH